MIPSSRQPRSIPAELWYGKRQDVSHLQPFGTTAYTHIPGDLNLSKLYPRLVKVSLLGYFGRESYKLLERSTGTVFKSRNVIFEEGSTHFTKQPTPIPFDEENDPFPFHHMFGQPIPSIKDERSDNNSQDTNQGNFEQLSQKTAPRPLPMLDLHDRKVITQLDKSVETSSSAEIPTSTPDKHKTRAPNSVIAQQSHRESKPST